MRLLYIADHLTPFLLQSISTHMLLQPVNLLSTMASLHLLLFIFTFLRFNAVNAVRQWTVDQSHCPGFRMGNTVNFWNDAQCAIIRSGIHAQGPLGTEPFYFPDDKNTPYKSVCCKVFIENGQTSGQCAYLTTKDYLSLNEQSCLNGRHVRSITYYPWFQLSF